MIFTTILHFVWTDSYPLRTGASIVWNQLDWLSGSGSFAWVGTRQNIDGGSQKNFTYLISISRLFPFGKATKLFMLTMFSLMSNLIPPVSSKEAGINSSLTYRQRPSQSTPAILVSTGYRIGKTEESGTVFPEARRFVILPPEAAAPWKHCGNTNPRLSWTRKCSTIRAHIASRLVISKWFHTWVFIVSLIGGSTKAMMIVHLQQMQSDESLDVFLFASFWWRGRNDA